MVGERVTAGDLDAEENVVCVTVCDGVSVCVVDGEFVVDAELEVDEE